MSDIPLPKIKVTLDFLRRWPSAFLHLVAIPLKPETNEKDTPVAKAFTREDIDNGVIAGWLLQWHGKANLYFTVNSLTGPLDKKAKKTDMGTVVAFHVDIDVPAGADQEAEAAAIVERIKSCAVPPSAIIESGGGAQAFWVLLPSDRIVIDGDVAKAEEAERYTRYIEAQFSAFRGAKADPCHNVDRIMRLPGTVNMPDAKKIAKGRKPRLATLVEFSDLRYPLGVFTPAAPKSDAKRPRALAQGDDNEPPVTSLDDPRLKELDPDVRVALETGRHPKHDAPGQRDFHVVCDLVRIGCSDKTIKTAWRISPISKGSESWPRGFEREMDRIIQRARERAVDPDLMEMNDRHCVVKLGGKTRIMTWEDDEMFEGRKVPSYSTVDDFCAFHSNKSKTIIKKNPEHDPKDPNSPENLTKTYPLGSWWWSQKHRRQYDGITFAPHIDSDVAGGKLNLWTGFAYAPSAQGSCQLYLDHLKDNICQGNEENYDYLIKSMANAVQHPGRQGNVSTVLLGKKGTGKTFAVEHFGKLFGRHYLPITNPEQLTGKFNKHLQQCVVVLADECFFAGNRQHEQIIKTLITGEHLMVEPKGVDAYPARNCLHMFMATNQAWAVPATEDERRYFVLKVGEARIQDTDYFAAIVAQLEAGGYEALLHVLLNMDLTGFNVRKVPKTDALREQQALSRRGIDALIETVAHTAWLPFQHHRYPNVASTKGERRGEGFWGWARDTFPDLARSSPHALARALGPWGCTVWNSGGPHIRFPDDIADLRQRFDERHGAQDWNHDPAAWVLGLGARPANAQEVDNAIPF